MIERVAIDPSTDYKVLMQKFGIKKGKAFLSKQRGYVSIVTKHVGVVADKKDFDVIMAYKMAASCYKRKIVFRYGMYDFDDRLKEDMIQEAVLRMYELSEKIRCSTGRKQQMFSIAKNAMHTVLNKSQMAGPMAGRVFSFEEEVLGHGIYESGQIDDGQTLAYLEA